MVEEVRGGRFEPLSQKKKKQTRFQFFLMPVDHPRDPPITKLFCQVGQQFKQSENEVSRLKRTKRVLGVRCWVLAS
jgi:hypothetical protein